MGGGHYSFESRTTRAETLGYTTKSAHQIFEQRSINNAMDPCGVDVRECRDSDDHPETIPVIIALDVTGSMGSIPHHLVKEGLPTLMSSVIQRGAVDAQILFLAVGDHECDRSPLQAGQFESSDELLDHWLTNVFLEGGGGANGGESYLLPWYFAAYHTATDAWEKRRKKGFLFTIGDEPNLKNVSAAQLRQIMGTGQYQDFSDVELLEKAREKYHVIHLHIAQTSSGRRQYVMDDWKQLMHDDCVIVDDYKDLPKIIADKVIELDEAIAPTPAAPAPQTKPETTEEEIIL